MVTTAVRYLRPEFGENRHYFGPGFDIMTGAYESRDVVMHDGRDARLDLQTTGVELLDCPTVVPDLRAFAAGIDSSDLFNGVQLHDSPYCREVCAAVRDRTLADRVLTLNCIMRSSRDDRDAAQGVARQAHVDFNRDEAGRIATALLDMRDGEPRSFSRFLMTSFWRILTPPPHSVPLAVCDASSVAPDDAVDDYMIFCERPPDPAEQAAPLPASGVCAASLFHYNPAHRWYWIADMLPREALLFKLCDSDRRGAWRTPHTAVQNPLADPATVRESIECRTIAYFA